eukprot:1900003-Rhodomonas_salina.1
MSVGESRSVVCSGHVVAWSACRVSSWYKGTMLPSSLKMLCAVQSSYPANQFSTAVSVSVILASFVGQPKCW